MGDGKQKQSKMEDFEIINDMLHEIKGGSSSLFNFSMENLDFELKKDCLEVCRTTCENGVGTVDGTTKGVEIN